MSMWTDARVETIKALWNDGWSGAQIAEHIGGVSRSAVLAKLARIGELKKDTGVRTPRRRAASQTLPSRPRISHNPLPPKPLPPEPAVPQPALRLEDGRHVGLRELTSQMCHWPIGDPCDADFHYCGNPPAPHRNYCEAHAGKARQPQGGKGGGNASAA